VAPRPSRESHRKKGADGVRGAVAFLASLNEKLFTCAMAVVGITVTNALVVLLGLLLKRSGNGLLAYTIVPVLSVLCACMAITGGIAFELLRRRGHSYYEAIGDEIQTLLRQGIEREDEGASESKKYRPAVETQLVLRQYVDLSSLPLVPGLYGPLIYLTLNLLLTGIAVSRLI
jgi:hypothetical protein